MTSGERHVGLRDPPLELDDIKQRIVCYMGKWALRSWQYIFYLMDEFYIHHVKGIW